MSGLLRALRRRWLSAVGAATVLSACAVFAIFQLMPPKYNVTIRLRVLAKQAGDDETGEPFFRPGLAMLLRSIRFVENPFPSQPFGRGWRLRLLLSHAPLTYDGRGECGQDDGYQ